MAPVQSFVSITPTWHNSPYPKISPTRPELSAKGKSLLITGGGTGIGLAVARGFATAGVREIALTGRRIGVLNKAAEALKKDFAGVRVLALVMDVTVKESVDRAFEEAIKAFGRVDICVSNAGYSPPPTPIATIDPQDWLQGFDTNVKGSLYVIQAFLKDAKVGSFLLNTSSGIGHMPALAGLSSYSSSKAAGIKMFESVAAENPGINVFNVQPGMIITDVHRVGNAGNELDVDDGRCPHPLPFHRSKIKD
jgi:NAD(P)-dependent dehydrogenase (short-subunit alcohol dehydrogenase family)